MSDINRLIDKIKEYDQNADIELITKAYEFAKEAHKDQKRVSGEPYITHPVATAEILVDLEMDSISIASALLHDVVEDQDYSIDDIKTNFGQEVAKLVDAVTKLQKADFEVDISEEQESDVPKKKKVEFRRSAESLRKIFLAMAKDFRVLLIKLADRLHNMRTLDGMSPDRQKRIAQETMQIYAPLAHRLGIWKIKWELEDLAFKYLEPEAYEEIAAKVTKTREEREDDLQEAKEMLERSLLKAGIKADIMYRPKHLWSIYQKIHREEVDFNDIYDLSALRVIVDQLGDCYHALGVVHELWMPIPERISDYIAKPKSNMYQSLHTKVIGPRGEPLEVQIRTWAMHRTAEFGIAAHWQYKERTRAGDEFDRKLSWLRQQLFDWQTDSKDAGEFLHSVINDLFTDQVFVFTPRGDVIDLPAGSTPVDFAYRIHSDVGNHCVGAKVNGRIVPLTYTFHNGDIVEIITRSSSQPSLDWVSFVKTSQAKNRIKSFYRKEHYAESVAKGREILERELQKNNLDHHSFLKSGEFLNVVKSLNMQNEEDLFAAIGFGNVHVGNVVNKLKPEEKPTDVLQVSHTQINEKKGVSVTLDGVKNLMISRAKCCQPLPGEEVLGYVSRGKGVVLHSVNCPNVQAYKEKEPERLVHIDWHEKVDEIFPINLKLVALDRVGLLNDVTAILSESKVNIASAKVKSQPNKTTQMDLTIELRDSSTLNSIMKKLSDVPDVLSIERISYNRTRRSSR
ncbi:MAG: bifunctional (p)ppGpp synthetase/guanosine-3',5'-bis(diphosphate) 3'-pyrophosphohydrolase [Armatimonadota bacterium]